MNRKPSPAIHILYQTILNDDGEEIETDRWPNNGLRNAIADLTSTRTSEVGGVEATIAQYQPWNSTLLVTVCNSAEYRTGCREERMLAVIDITHASARRLARLLNAQINA